MNVRHNWLLCMLHTVSNVDKMALPSNIEEFQFSLISKIWKSTGTRALPICTSRFLTIPHELSLRTIHKSEQGSTFRPIWSAITLGRMMTDAHVSHSACGNSIPFTYMCNHILHLVSGLFEEHPQYVGILKTLFWKFSISFSLAALFRCLATFPFLFLKVLPIGALSTSIGSAASSESVMVVFGGLAEDLGCGMSALRQGTSIFGIYTRYVRGVRRSMGARDDHHGHAGRYYHLEHLSESEPCLAAQYRSMSGMENRSMSDGRCRSMEDECLRSTVVSEYRSTGLVSGSTVVERNRATSRCCCRSMRSTLFADQTLQTCKIWDIDRYTFRSVDRLFNNDIDRRASS
ncbi:hypothetical protein IGI04_006985 [Brassica rapa subsp. trilocularis]|uniref:Uncharacterized protein n=1 Tax=Brassica rapa subsp. trilocularis TaxID=1813537 RepID=A0ABQ7NJP4_BRACM|nr:hypothetical protein IGI04_006985 [Brassica rapa subsp. trilocularis]